MCMDATAEVPPRAARAAYEPILKAIWAACNGLQLPA